ncbi:hypothetical protein CE195_11245 [Sodalis-like symbiont of Philaenus spumarius]|nr:hypothetical protein CE195_11245 [Sodalis-like symbiont of Philaenus spumarius]
MYIVVIIIFNSFHVITVSVHCPRCHSDEIYRHGLRAY